MKLFFITFIPLQIFFLIFQFLDFFILDKKTIPPLTDLLIYIVESSSTPLPEDVLYRSISLFGVDQNVKVHKSNRMSFFLTCEFSYKGLLVEKNI